MLRRCSKCWRLQHQASLCQDGSHPTPGRSWVQLLTCTAQRPLQTESELLWLPVGPAGPLLCMVMLCRLAAVSLDGDFAWGVQIYGQHGSERLGQALKSTDCYRLLMHCECMIAAGRGGL